MTSDIAILGNFFICIKQAYNIYISNNIRTIKAEDDLDIL